MSGLRQSILIVDDNKHDRAFMSGALEGLDRDIDIHEVCDGVELLEYLRATSPAQPFPDLVLLDFQMPRMNGFEALRAIRDDPALGYVPVVTLFSTASDPEFVRSAYAAGANAFVCKPGMFGDLDELMSTIVHHWFDAAILP